MFLRRAGERQAWGWGQGQGAPPATAGSRCDGSATRCSCSMRSRQSRGGQGEWARCRVHPRQAVVLRRAGGGLGARCAAQEECGKILHLPSGKHACGGGGMRPWQERKAAAQRQLWHQHRHRPGHQHGSSTQSVQWHKAAAAAAAAPPGVCRWSTSILQWVKLPLQGLNPAHLSGR